MFRHHRFPPLCLAALVILAGAPSMLEANVQPTARQRPHVVIILVDDLGYGDPGCFNTRSKIPTPTIDRFAREGVRFTDAHAPGPLCHVSRYGLLTGTYPFRGQVGKWSRQPVIEADRPTIASLARQAGYVTAMVGKWHLGFDERGYDRPLRGGPVDRGFDTFFGIRASTDIPPYFYIRSDRAVQPPTGMIAENHTPGWSPIQGAFWRAGGIAPDFKHHEVLPRFTDEAIAVIRQHARGPGREGRPLFLYLAYPAPHTPWLPHERFRGTSGAGLYGDFVAMVDAEIGRVLAELQRQEFLQNTLLILTSDNGPVWYPHDTERFGHDSTGGLRGMKADAWEAGHRMPFIVRWPGHAPAGTVCEQLICFTDIMATLADVWGMRLPPNSAADSFSFLPLIRNPRHKPPVRGPFVMKSGNGKLTLIRWGRWKLIDGHGSGGFTRPGFRAPGPDEPPGQLYDLAHDLRETRNLYAQHPHIVHQLTALMKRILDAPMSRTLPMPELLEPPESGASR